MKTLNVILFVVSLALLATFFVPKEVSAKAGATNTSYASETFTPVNGTIDTTAGNIYQYNLTGEDKTYRWVGLWGNISGSIKLKTSSNDFRTWTVGTVTQGSILYATTNPNGITPSSFQGTDNADLNSADTAYGFANTVTDSITNTYTGTTTFQSPSMQSGISVNSTTMGATWVNYMIQRDATAISAPEHIVWAAYVDPAQTAFNGGLADYELLIPENEEAGDGEGSSTTYYLWLEFN